MNPDTFEVVDGVAHFRLAGPWGFRQAVQAASAAITRARGLGLARLLIVTTQASGFTPPSVFERHAMARELSVASGSRITVAMVVPAAFIDPERFGVVAAANFGLHLHVFEDETEALEWLLAS
jgi:hypothetical protein